MFVGSISMLVPCRSNQSRPNRQLPVLRVFPSPQCNEQSQLTGFVFSTLTSRTTFTIMCSRLENKHFGGDQEQMALFWRVITQSPFLCLGSPGHPPSRYPGFSS